MAASPVKLAPQAPVPSTKVEGQESSTGRFLLSEFESVNDPQISMASKTSSLSVDTNIEFKASTTISPNCVMNLPARSTSSKDEISTSESENPENESPLVKAVQCDFQTGMVTHLPTFHLHGSLMRNLAQAHLNRISFYGAVIHDINKEASEMAANDSSSFVESSPNLALIDEEAWLINIIANRSKEETGGLPKTCPSSFAEAIGETDADSSNPLSNLNSSRTQLWKPSRSWWEARSGKNPWIEPKSHNKRWRYLWPMIHYHKFLARCIKKLKRNRVEVHNSHSPVCVFLRDEVCAISGHLADVSKFTSEEWLESLSNFEGWTDPCQEPELRELVKIQKLRCLAEPSDVNSTLLKNQVDEQFLRAMENARLNMQGIMKTTGDERKESMLDTITEVNQAHPNSRFPINNRPKTFLSKSKRRQNKVQKYPFYNNQTVPPHFLDQSMHQYSYPPRNPRVNHRPTMMNDSTHEQFYPHHPYQHTNMYNAHQQYYSHQFSQHPVGGFYHHHPFMPMHNASNHLHDGFMPGPAFNALGSPAVHPTFQLPNPSPNVMNIQNHEFHHPVIGMHQPSPSHDSAVQTPLSVPPSPYWGHLDPMSGLASPQNPPYPSRDTCIENERIAQTPNQSNKQPFMNPIGPFNYNFQQYGRNFVPPSPASQFLMSQTPQASGRFSNSINMASHSVPSSFSFDISQDKVEITETDKDGEDSSPVTTPSSKSVVLDKETKDANEEKSEE